MLIRNTFRPLFSNNTSHTTTTTLTSILKQRSTFSSPSTTQFTSPIHRMFSTHRVPRTLPSRLSRNPLVLTALGFSLPFYASTSTRNITYNDTSPSPSFSTSSYSHSRDAKTPLSKDGGRTLNPRAIRQISLGSMLGLGLGMLVSAFSRSLVLLLGLGLVAWQWAARKGYNIIPVQRVQKYVKGVDLRSAINDNVAFKVSFGLMFALSAFGNF